MIVVIDYGTGNSGSNLNMLRKIGAQAVVSACPDVISQAQGLVLPGVGAFDAVAGSLAASGLRELIEDRVVRHKTPFLGVCVGLQLLFKGSEEGVLPGLDWIPGAVRKFHHEQSAGTTRLTVPHMGWNRVAPIAGEPLFNGLETDSRFYFVHSYHVECDPEYVIANATYGYEYACAVRHENIMGVQFHPEKSHRFGMQLYRNFVALACS